MNMKIMMRFLCISWSALSYGHTETQKKETSSSLTQKESQEPATNNLKKNGMAQVMGGFVWGCVGQIVGSGIMYNTDEKFRKYYNDRCATAKNLFIQKVAIPVHLKVHAIKDEGLTTKDIVKIIGLLGGLYGLKKIGDYFSLWQALKGNTSQTVKAIEDCVSYVANHPGKSIVVSGTFLALLAMMVQARQRVGKVVTPAELFESLTNDQLKKIDESCTLAAAIRQIETDPYAALMHKDLLNLLTAEQRELLEQIAAEHDKNNPHLALLD